MARHLRYVTLTALACLLLGFIGVTSGENVLAPPGEPVSMQYPAAEPLAPRTLLLGTLRRPSWFPSVPVKGPDDGRIPMRIGSADACGRPGATFGITKPVESCDGSGPGISATGPFGPDAYPTSGERYRR